MTGEDKDALGQMERAQDRRHRVRARLFSRVHRPLVGQVIPNGITVVATCSGMMGLVFALREAWGFAVLAVIVAAIMDTLDGRMARVLGSSSHFGAELDSLSDVISFGVCPAMILYLWGMQEVGNWGVMAVLLFVVCCLLRLARFNTMAISHDTESEMSLVWCHFFQGVPAPMGGCLLLMPIVADLAGLLEAGRFFAGEVLPFFWVGWSSVLALLMISSVPVFSLKTVRVPRNMALYFMALGVPLVTATLVSSPWILLLLLGVAALLSLPVSVWYFLRLCKTVKTIQEVEESVHNTTGRVAAIVSAGDWRSKRGRSRASGANRKGK